MKEELGPCERENDSDEHRPTEDTEPAAGLAAMLRPPSSHGREEDWDRLFGGCQDRANFEAIKGVELFDRVRFL
jgi:hypothetical protein